MLLDGLDRDRQGVGDLAVGEAALEQAEDLALPARELDGAVEVGLQPLTAWLDRSAPPWAAASTARARSAPEASLPR